jgi:hypothetical protein
MNSERGNREWLNEYPSLKQVKSNNPFTVPEGYFNELEQQITSLVKLDELKKDAASEGFTVPENYFDELSAHIQSRIKIEEVLDKDTAGHTVPAEYFENLSQQIQSRIMIEEALCEPTEIFAVPQDYFEQLSQDILNKTVNQEDLKQEVIKKKGVVRQLFASSTFRYATAACITLAVGATVLLTQNSAPAVENHNNSFLHKSLSAIPVDEIKNYLKDNDDQTDTRTLIDDSKQVNADNLSNDLQDELDTSQ